MRKFVVHTRAVPGCCKGASDAPTILEVEGELVTSLDDPSVTWLPAGEFYFRITKPEFLYESKETKSEDGSKKKIMIPTVYHSHAIYHELVEAQAAAKRMIKSGMDFEVRKGRLAAYTEEELAVKCSEVQILELK